MQGLSRDEYDTSPSLFKKYAEARLDIMRTCLPGGLYRETMSRLFTCLEEVHVGRDGLEKEDRLIANKDWIEKSLSEHKQGKK